MCVNTVFIDMRYEVSTYDNSKNCDICLDKAKSPEYKCLQCKKSICCECFYKISADFFNADKKNMEMKLKCPYCRYESNYTYQDFTKSEIIILANNHIAELDSFVKQSQVLKELKQLKEELQKYKDRVSLLEGIKHSLQYKINEYEKINQYIDNRKTKYIQTDTIKKLINKV